MSTTRGTAVARGGAGRETRQRSREEVATRRKSGAGAGIGEAGGGERDAQLSTAPARQLYQ